MADEMLQQAKSVKSQSPEEQIFDENSDTIKQIKSSKNGIFYFSIILLNICMLAVTILYLKNTQEIAGIKEFADYISLKTWLLLLSIFIIITFIKTLPDFLRLFEKSKQRKFGTLYYAGVASTFYKCVTLYSKTSDAVNIDIQFRGGISAKNSVYILYSHKHVRMFTTFYLLLTLMILSKAFLKINSIFNVIALVVMLGLLCYLSLINIFYKKKKTGVAIVGKISKLLHDLKLTRDYEKVYNKTNNKMGVYTKTFKAHKAIYITNIASNYLIEILRATMLFLILTEVGIVGMTAYIHVLYGVVILDIIIAMLPLPKGTIVADIIFIILFKNLFTYAYVVWGLVIYKLFEYFAVIIWYLIVKLLFLLLEKKSKIVNYLTKSS